jgi:N-acetylmuramoyl-L-alanine amidase
MNITTDHWFEAVDRQLLEGGSVMSIRRFLVIHFTSGWSAQSSVDFWKTAGARGASAHVIIDRDGAVIQTRPFNCTCGHAGVSRWKDPNTGETYIGLNTCAIGIELANAGDMVRSPDIYPRSMQRLASRPIERLTARHKNGGPISQWEIYPPEQLKALEIVCKGICQRYNIDDLVGHDDIAPDRKNDPGPAFPMQALREACGFTKPLGKL